jgi:hypothetical protein
MTPGLLERLLEHERNWPSARPKVLTPPAEAARGPGRRARSGSRFAADAARLRPAENPRSTARHRWRRWCRRRPPALPRSKRCPRSPLQRAGPRALATTPSTTMTTSRPSTRSTASCSRSSRKKAEELLPQLQSRLRDWALHPSDNDAPRPACARCTPSRAASRLAGAMRLGEMAHRLETAIEHLAARPVATRRRSSPCWRAPTPWWRPTRPAAQAGRRRGALSPRPPRRRGAAGAGRPAGRLVRRRCCAGRTARPAASALARQRRPGGPESGRLVALQRPQACCSAGRGRAGAGGAAAVRVRAGLLDRLVNHAGEVSITRARIDADVRQLQGSR